VREFVGRHPVTGEPLLQVNEMHTDRVIGLDPDSSESLLAEVYAYLYGPHNVYEHAWKVGDLIIWDNIAVHHGRPPLPERGERTLQRVTLGTKTAYELVPNLPELLARAKSKA
jgi:taurine dioxygenase